MRDQPDGAALLNTARKILREELLESLPADKRLAALMIANAMGIAERQIVAGEEPARTELIRLGRLLGERVDRAAPLDELQDSLVRLNRRLCALIRRGRADPGCGLTEDVVSHLRMVSRQTLFESNPKYLGEAG